VLNVSHTKGTQADAPPDELAQAMANIEAAQRAIRQLNGQRGPG
jgi:hypothetical protein